MEENEKKSQGYIEQTFGYSKDMSASSIDEAIENQINQEKKVDIGYSFDFVGGKKQENNIFFKKFLKILNSVMLYLIIFSFTLGIGAIIFFEFIISKNNSIIAFYNEFYPFENLGMKIEKQKEEINKKKDEIKSISSKIDSITLKIPKIIFYNNENYKNLDDNLKKELEKFYDKQNGKLLITSEKDRLMLEELFKGNDELSKINIYFDKEYIINSIKEKKIYWKDVYKSLTEATNNAFKYNEVLKYIKYETFAVDKDGRVSISGTIQDPSGRVFNQLINLVNSINSHGDFEGAKSNVFQKTENPDKGIGGMVSSLSLSFYFKNKK